LKKFLSNQKFQCQQYSLNEYIILAYDWNHQFLPGFHNFFGFCFSHAIE
jgi:hypothetical protein